MEVYVDVCCVRGRGGRVVHYLTTISLLEMWLGNSDTTYLFSLQIQGGIILCGHCETFSKI